MLLAGNGAEAVALYAQRGEEISLVLTDMAMPVMDGPATIAAIRSLNPRVKVVGSSGLSMEGGVSRFGGTGLKYFVPKPYTAETMLQTLSEALREQ